MSDWTEINHNIDSNIYTNGNRAISAATLNTLMKSMLQAVGNNLPTPGTGLRQGTGTDFVRELSIDGEYTSYYATSAGEDEYTRVCMLRNGTLLYNNIMIAVGYQRYTGRKSDLLFINVGGAEPAIQTLTSSGTFFLENAGSGTFFLCVKKETSSNTILKCAFSVLMASQNDGFDIKSGVLSSFDFLTTEEATTGAIIASTCLTDALGFTPENPANKKTTLADNSDTYYPTQKAVKTAVDDKVTGAASSTDNAIARFDGITGKLVKDSGVYIDDSGNVVIPGNATINGTLTTINSETLQVKDKNIEIAKVDTPTDDTADGGGITLLGATNKTITWVKSKLSWVFNQAVEISGNLNVIGNVAVSGTVDGRDVSSDGLKLDTTVVGPASSVANEVPVYDDTTGKVLKSGSGVSAVGGNLTATNDMASATKTIANKVRMEYDSATDTLKFNFL